MATILKARGRMTKDLVTPYGVGDQVVALINERQRHGRVRVGDVGTIRRISISDPNDGDDTFLMFYVKVARGTVLLHQRVAVTPHRLVIVRRGPNATVITCACGAKLPVLHRAGLSIAEVMQRHIRNGELRRGRRDG